MRMHRVEPGRPVPDHPKSFGGRRRIRSDHDTAALGLVGGSIPSDDEAILRGKKIGAFVEIDEVVGIALEALFVILVFAARKCDCSIVQLPTLQLAIIAGAVADDFRDPFHELQRILVNAAQNQGAFVRGQREAKAEVGFATARLTAIEQLIGRTPIGIGLGARIGCPGDMGGCPMPDGCGLVAFFGSGISQATGNFAMRVGQLFCPSDVWLAARRSSNVMRRAASA